MKKMTDDDDDDDDDGRIIVMISPLTSKIVTLVIVKFDGVVCVLHRSPMNTASEQKSEQKSRLLTFLFRVLICEIWQKCFVI